MTTPLESEGDSESLSRVVLERTTAADLLLLLSVPVALLAVASDFLAC